MAKTHFVGNRRFVGLGPLSVGLGAPVALAGGGWRPTFLLRDDFITTEAAPLASPRSAEPGPGTGTVTGPANQSITGGVLTIDASGAYIYYGARTRTTGLGMFASVTLRASINPRMGFNDATADANPDSQALVMIPNGIAILDNGLTSFLVSGSVSAGQTYRLAIVLRSSGAFYFVKGEAFTDWTLLFVAAVNTTTTLYPVIRGETGYDFARVTQLPAPFDNDYGLATQRLAGSVSAGQTFTHEANFVGELTFDVFGGTSTAGIKFRMQDANNYWRAFWDKNVKMVLHEVVAGVATERASATFTPTVSKRMVIIADGNTIRGYYDDVLRWAYSSASNFASATSGEADGPGTYSMSSLVTWPRNLSGAAATYLDQAVAQ